MEVEGALPAAAAAPVVGGASAAPCVAAVLEAVQQGDAATAPLPPRPLLLGAMTQLLESVRSPLLAGGGAGGDDADAALQRIDPAAAQHRLHRLLVNPDWTQRFMSFAERVFSESPDDAELRRTCSNVFGAMEDALHVARALERWVFTLEQGSAVLDTRDGSDVPNVTRVEQDVVKRLVAQGYRLRKPGAAESEDGALLFAEKRIGAIRTHAWVPVRHPVHHDQKYTLASFVHHHVSANVNAELNSLTGGQVTRGAALIVIKNLHCATIPMLPPIRPHAHGFAFRDGIYIGFIHDGDEHGGEPYAALWRAIESGEVAAGLRGADFAASPCSRWHSGARVAGDVFLTYDQVGRLLPRAYTVSTFVDHLAAEAMGVGAVAAADWRRLPSRCVDHVMRCQWGDPGISAADRQRREERLRRYERCGDLDKNFDDVSSVAYAMMGRLFFPANRRESSADHELDSRLDTWEMAPFLKGLAGTGKSTLGGVVTRYLQPTDVGMLSNRSEEMFWGQTLCLKRLVTALELKKNCNFDPAALQMAISGEKMAIATKGENTQDCVWRAPLLFAGNEMPSGWGDSSGALSRRILVFEYQHAVPVRCAAEGSPQGEIDALVHATPECAALLRKMYCAYLSMTLRFGDAMLFRERPQRSASAKGLPQEAFDGCPLPKAMHMWHEAKRHALNDMLNFLLDSSVWVVFPAERLRARLLESGIEEDLAEETANLLMVTPFTAVCGGRGAATTHIRNNTVNDAMRRCTINAKDLTAAIDEFDECGMTYDAAGAGATAALGHAVDESGQYQLLSTTQGGCVRGAALRRTLTLASQHLQAGAGEGGGSQLAAIAVALSVVLGAAAPQDAGEQRGQPRPRVSEVAQMSLV